MQLVSDRTMKVPTHRLRCKTPRASLKHYKLIYKPGMGPRPAAKTLVAHKKQYRVMYYKAKNSIAIRQCAVPKSQIGSCVLPHGMPVGQGRWIAQQCRIHFLEVDPTWEPYTSDLLQQLLLTAPDYNNL